MLLEIFILLQFFVVVSFIVSFFTKHELMWVVTILFSVVIMFSAYSIQVHYYVYNVTTTGYDYAMTSYSYGYLSWLNGGLFFLSMLLMIYDIFDKYGKKAAEGIDVDETRRE